MIILDLKPVLFVVLVAVVLSSFLCLRAIRRARLLRGMPNRVLSSLPDELPFGLAIVDASGALLHTNGEAHRLLSGRGTDVSTTGIDAIRSILTSSPRAARTNGVVSYPVPLRWWHFALSKHTSAIILFDNQELQRVISRQQVFTGYVSHELRSPLTSVLAHLDIVRNPVTPDTLRESSLSTVYQEAQRLARLVRDLLEYYRIETAGSLVLLPTNVVLVAEAAITQVFAKAEEHHVTLSLEADEVLPLVRANADRLKQVFLNLLDNAITYGGPGSTVSVRLATAPSGVQCSISDTGPGIPEPELQHVTEPLYRAQTDIEGTGIGLAIVTEILVHHGAALKITSSTQPGASGTTCSWILPAMAQEPS